MSKDYSNKLAEKYQAGKIPITGALIGRIGNQVLIPERTHHCERGVSYIGHWLRLGRRAVMMNFEPEDLPVIYDKPVFRLWWTMVKPPVNDCGLFLSSFFGFL